MKKIYILLAAMLCVCVFAVTPVKFTPGGNKAVLMKDTGAVIATQAYCRAHGGGSGTYDTTKTDAAGHLSTQHDAAVLRASIATNNNYYHFRDTGLVWNDTIFKYEPTYKGKIIYTTYTLTAAKTFLNGTAKNDMYEDRTVIGDGNAVHIFTFPSNFHLIDGTAGYDYTLNKRNYIHFHKINDGLVEYWVTF
jgi:hypothetical protein